jgi:hypothetical protein
MIVRDQKVGGVVHRFVYLASQADLKRVSVLDVTNDVTTELAAVAGVPDGDSIFLLGHNLYLGTNANASGPELYEFDAANPSGGLPVKGSAEVGANVTALTISGAYAYLGTGPTSGQIQVWSSDLVSHLQNYNFSHLVPTGLDVDGNWLYAISQFQTGDALQVLYTP